MSCEHVWIVTSWKVEKHSRSAQELMCEKCTAFIKNEELGQRRKPVCSTPLPFHISEDSANPVY